MKCPNCGYVWHDGRSVREYPRLRKTGNEWWCDRCNEMVEAKTLSTVTSKGTIENIVCAKCGCFGEQKFTPLSTPMKEG